MPLTSDCYKIRLSHHHLQCFVILRFSRICSKLLSRICLVISQLQVKSIKNYASWNIKSAILLPSHQKFKFSTSLVNILFWQWKFSIFAWCFQYCAELYWLPSQDGLQNVPCVVSRRSSRMVNMMDSPPILSPSSKNSDKWWINVTDDFVDLISVFRTLLSESGFSRCCPPITTKKWNQFLD